MSFKQLVRCGRVSQATSPRVAVYFYKYSKRGVWYTVRLYFNRAFCREFIKEEHEHVRVLLDLKKNKLGLIFLTKNEAKSDDYYLTRNKKTPLAIQIGSIKHLLYLFENEKSRKKIYEAKKAANGMIIIDLNTECL